MNSLQRGWTFLVQSLRMLAADRDLIKPSIYALFAGLAVTVIFAVPVVLFALLLGDSTLGQVLTGFFGVVLLFAQIATGYIFSAMTVYLVYGYLAEGDGIMSKAWAIVRRDFWDLLSLAAVGTLVSLLRSVIRGGGKNGGGFLRRALADLLGAVWTEASYLLLPAMVIEDRNLKDGLVRVAQITRENLLLVGVSMVGVGAINGLIGFVLGAIGVGLGLAAGFGIASLGSSTVLIILAIGLGILLASLFILAAVILTSYIGTAYHTCLFLWARDVETARYKGQTTEALPPAPLAAALGN